MEPFITQQDLSDQLGRDVTSDDGALFAITAASDICRTVAEQTFSAVSGGTVVLDGTGTDVLLLPELPVTAAGTVSENGTLLASTDYALGDTGRLIRLSGTLGYVRWLRTTSGQWSNAGAAVWPAGRRNVTVTYDHGYGTADIPNDVRMVALALAERIVIQGPAQAETVGDTSIRYGTNSTDLTNGEKLILTKYRQR